MKKLVRIISIIFIITIISSQIALGNEISKTQVVPKFTDLMDSHWAYESIQKLVGVGIINGYSDGTFKPDGYITRAELVKIVNLVFSYTQKQEITNFTDVKPEDWFYENVLIAQKSGYIVGYPEGTFQPNGFITRQELCKILDTINNFVELPYDKSPVDDVSPWAIEYVKKVVSNRIMLLDEKSNFRATQKATRAEACDALAKFIILAPSTELPSTGGSTGTGNEDLSKDELYKTMDTVTRRLEKGVIPNLTSATQKEIINDIIINMNEYKTDNKHDYEAAANKVYEKYKKLTEKEQNDLKYQIQLQNSTKDLLELKDFFFPEADI